MLNEQKVTIAPECEPISLIDKAANLEERLIKVLNLAESIHSELYGPVPIDCSEDGNKPRYSLEETVNQMNRTVSRLGDCLSDTLKRLRG